MIGYIEIVYYHQFKFLLYIFKCNYTIFFIVYYFSTIIIYNFSYIIENKVKNTTTMNKLNNSLYGHQQNKIHGGEVIADCFSSFNCRML